jgi:anti-anti-sigma factor
MEINSAITQEDFTIDIIDGISIIKLNLIKATFTEAKAFKQVLDLLIIANHHKLILDFTDTRFIDSAIANVMLNVIKEIRKMKGDILTITPNGSINNIFIQTKLNKIFKQYNTTHQAISEFASA